MSQFNAGPAETINPVAEQVVSAGNQLHDEALRGGLMSPEALRATLSPDLQAAIAAERLKNQMAQGDPFAVTNAWQAKPQVQFVIQCPSGQRCLAKHLNTMDLVDADLIEEVDFFTKKLFPSSLDAAGNPVDNDSEELSNQSFWGTLKDAEKKARFFRLLNKLLAIGIVKPRVVDDGVGVVVDELGSKKVVFGTSARPLREGEVYASAIDFADKIVIFGELNKPLEQINPFREESSAELPSVSAGEGVTG